MKIYKDLKKIHIELKYAYETPDECKNPFYVVYADTKEQGKQKIVMQNADIDKVRIFIDNYTDHNRFPLLRDRVMMKDVRLVPCMEYSFGEYYRRWRADVRMPDGSYIAIANGKTKSEVMQSVRTELKKGLTFSDLSKIR